MNVFEKTIREIKRCKKVAEESFEVLCSTNINSDHNSNMEELNLESTDTFKEIDEGSYFYYDGRILKGQKHEKNLYRFKDIKNDYLYGEFTSSKLPKSSDSKAKYERITSLEKGKTLKSFLTGLPLLYDKGNKSLQFKEGKGIELKGGNFYGYTTHLFINEKIIDKRTTYEKSRHIYGRSTEVNSYIDTSTHTKILDTYKDNEKYQYLKDIMYSNFQELDAIPKDAILIKEVEEKTSWGSSKELSRFYYSPELGKFIIRTNFLSVLNSYHNFSFDAFDYKDIRYALIEGYLICISKDLKERCVTALNNEFTEKVFNYYAILNENYEVEFKYNYASKYLRLFEEQFIVYKNKVINKNNLGIKTDDNGLTVTKCILPIAKDITDYTSILPFSFNDITYYIVLKDDKLSIFFKAERFIDSWGNLVFSSMKRLKFKRSNSDIYIYNDNLYVLEDDYDLYKLELEKFKESSIVVTGRDSFYIEDINDNKWIYLEGKIYKLSHHPKYYDSVYSGDSILLKKANTIYYFGYKIEPRENNEICITTENKETIIKNAFIKDDKIICKLNSTLLDDLTPYFEFDLKDCYFGELHQPARIIIDNKNFVLYTVNTPECENVYLFSKKTKKCIKKDKSKLDNWYSILHDLNATDKLVFETIQSDTICVDGHFIKSKRLNFIKKLNQSLYDAILESLNKSIKDIKLTYDEDGYLKATTQLDNKITSCLVNEAKKYDLNIDNNDIDNYPNQKDITLVISCLNNILRHKDFSSELLKEIENSIKGKDTLSSDFYERTNYINRNEFVNTGISIERFNNFSDVVHFKGFTSLGDNLKSTLSNSLYSEINVILGSKNYNHPGILQLNNLKDLEGIHYSCKGENINLKDLLDNTTLQEKNILKIINNHGRVFYSVLKKYNITFDLINKELLVAGKRFVNISMSKIKMILEDFVSTKDKVSTSLLNSNILNSLIDELLFLLDWSISHIVSTLESTDFESPNNNEVKDLHIKLWDRHNIIHSLTEGYKSHCCLAVNSFNIDKLVEYIFNENITIVEIRDDKDTIGQAFVGVYTTREPIKYRYAYKKHAFMVIDNIELNNNYAQYADSISLNLQKFMANYMMYVSDNISDVLLGKVRNKVTPPYEFYQYLDLVRVGERRLYVDHGDTFYKFL